MYLSKVKVTEPTIDLNSAAVFLKTKSVGFKKFSFH